MSERASSATSDSGRFVVLTADIEVFAHLDDALEPTDPNAAPIWGRGGYISPTELRAPVVIHGEEARRRYPDLFVVDGALVGSPALVRAFTDAGVDNVQTFEAIIVEPDGSEARGYSLLNVLGRIAAVDWERTRVMRRARGKRQEVRAERLVLAPKRTYGFRMFVLHEADVVVISDALAGALHGMSGVALTDVDVWQGLVSPAPATA